MHDHKHGDDCGCHSQPETPEEEPLHCISDFVARNQNYKAAVYDLKADPPKYEVAIYKWTIIKGEEQPVWERIAGPIIMDSLPAAETWGQENLAIYAGEKLDVTVAESLRETVYKTLGNDDFDFLDPSNYQVSFLESEEGEEFLPIATPEKILVAGEFYFVEFMGKWLAGFLYDEATVRCWKTFDTLEEALLEVAV